VVIEEKEEEGEASVRGLSHPSSSSSCVMICVIENKEEEEKGFSSLSFLL
jgi:hypothetical protein